MRPRRLQAQRELLEEAGRLSVQYGCRFVEGEYGSLVIFRPDEPLPNRQREKAASETVLLLSRVMSYPDRGRLKSHVRELREANAMYETVQSALQVVVSTAFEAARSEAFMGLYRAGLDADPAYTAVARATDRAELWEALNPGQQAKRPKKTESREELVLRSLQNA